MRGRCPGPLDEGDPCCRRRFLSGGAPGDQGGFGTRGAQPPSPFPWLRHGPLPLSRQMRARALYATLSFAFAAWRLAEAMKASMLTGLVLKAVTSRSRVLSSPSHR